jgi:hypothetical protein
MFIGAGVNPVNGPGSHKMGAAQSIRTHQNAGGFDGHGRDIFDLLGGGSQGNEAVILHPNGFRQLAVGINVNIEAALYFAGQG